VKRQKWIWIGLAAALMVGGSLSLLASPAPDGLERVAAQKGFEATAAAGPLVRSPLASYLFPGIHDERVATGLAGFLGTLVIFAAGAGVGRLARMGGGKARGARIP
jgi:hypothetical protein